MQYVSVTHRISTSWLALALLLMQSLAYAGADAVERIEWKKVPIPLVLSVGQEQQIEFPAAVKVGVPASMQAFLRAQSINGTIYLLAHGSFPATRFMVREVDSGRIYLLDISSVEKAVSANPLQIFVSEDSDSGNALAIDGDGLNQRPPDYIQLSRFAAQQLYAPARLLKTQPGMVRVPVSRDPIMLMRGGGVEAKPLVAWRSRGLYVTAVKITNLSDQAQILDPRNLRGRWLSATFQHNRLLPQGDEADTTAVYLISARPFDISL